MNFRDIELLSAYLDGQVRPADSARLEARLQTDLELASALDALRASRTLLRRLPQRRAPRNFTLTPKMVGRKPPLPRTYPVFRFATALAAILFTLSFISNPVSQLAASAPAAYGVGGGGGSDPATEPGVMEVFPAATEAPATEAPFESALAQPTATSVPAEDAARNAEPTPDMAAKNGGELLPPPVPEPAPFIPSTWQVALGAIALIGAASMYVTQQLAARKWRGK